MSSVRHLLPAFGYLPDDPSTQPTAGIVVAALNQARGAAGAGYKVSLVTYSDGSDHLQLRIEEVDTVRVRPRQFLNLPRIDLSYALPVWFRTVGRPADIAHVHSNPYLLRFTPAKRKVLHYHTPDVVNSKPYVRAATSADALLFCSQALRDRFVHVVGEPHTPMHVVDNGIELERFSGNEAEGKALRATLGIREDDFVILFAGQLSPVKGPHVLAEACIRVAARTDRSIKLVLAGSSKIWLFASPQSDSSQFENQLRKTIGSNAIMPGAIPQHQMPALYAACDVFAAPSTWFEPSGIVIREAMASGKPVIASRIGGIPEMIDDGRTGLLVPPGDVDALAEAILTLIRNPARMASMSEQSKVRSARFDQQASVDQVLSIYEDLLNPTVSRSKSAVQP
jgi:glycosyltransferase involved in cell wall biosynthesis